jgi:tRNA threonylcarbamoyladenosine biosynthesis protein TsaE
MLCIHSNSARETEAAGKDFAIRLKPGDIIALKGDLGAGKTVFVRGIAMGIGCDESLVSSPTYALIHEYKGQRLSLCHVDAYRLCGPEDLSDIGFFDYLDNHWAAAVEWSERVAPVLDADFWVTLTPVDDCRREIMIEGRGI